MNATMQGRQRKRPLSLTPRSFHLWFCHDLPEQGKSVFGGLVCQEPLLQVLSVLRSKEATQYSAGGPLFQASQQWQVDQRQAQEASRKQSVPLLWYRRPQAGLLSQEADHGLSQGPRCFSNCF